MQFKNHDVIYNIHQYMFNQSIEAFEALYLFKEYFGSLLDPTIVAIYLNATNIIVVRKCFAHDDDLYVDRETTYVKSELTIDVMKQAYNTKQDKFHPSIRNLSTELSKVKYEQDYAAICRLVKQGLSLMHSADLKELELFGHNTLAYELYDAKYKMIYHKKLVSKIISNHDQSLKYVLQCLLSMSALTRQMILKDSVKRIKSTFQLVPATFHTIPEFESMWQQFGYCLTVDKGDQVQQALEEICQQIYDELGSTEKLALNLKDFIIEDLDIDIHYPFVDFKEILYEDGKEEIKRHCIAYAQAEWESTVQNQYVEPQANYNLNRIQA